MGSRAFAEASQLEQRLISTLVDNIAEPVPETVYHYTTLPGAHGILESGSIWASDMRFLNDRREWIHAIDLAAQTVRETEGVPVDLADSLLRVTEDLDYTRSFVACFSSDGDSLPQWRAYSQRGCALGFDTVRLSKLASEYPGSGMFVPVVYDEAEQRTILRHVVELISTHFQDSTPTSGDLVFSAGMFTKILTVYSPALKDPSFESEREWRLILGVPDPGGPAFRFRATGGAIVPYLSVRLSVEGTSILPSHVTIGPSPEPELVGEGVKQMIESLGASGVVVDPSKVPFRDWS